MHIKTILGAKLDCVAANFSSTAERVHSLKTVSFAACDLIDPEGLEAPPANSEEIHEVLHDLQEIVTDLCDNGAGEKAEWEILETLDYYQTTLESLI
jgi:hypothetical protein